MQGNPEPPAAVAPGQPGATAGVHHSMQHAAPAAAQGRSLHSAAPPLCGGASCSGWHTALILERRPNRSPADAGGHERSGPGPGPRACRVGGRQLRLHVEPAALGRALLHGALCSRPAPAVRGAAHAASSCAQQPGEPMQVDARWKTQGPVVERLCRHVHRAWLLCRCCLWCCRRAWRITGSCLRPPPPPRQSTNSTSKHCQPPQPPPPWPPRSTEAR